MWNPELAEYLIRINKGQHALPTDLLARRQLQLDGDV